ncbi:hypothetical protein [Hippea maritima]|uniref:Origin recognition complex 1 protein n=1 Tax=Hippea maritima (strain ATCC 700847 / DSM 10411 / MH2) TaxID=760142 RepID=F2LWD9_HIPMA|nr:hypothetical protein [Hippea maritima]AEA32985.1 origin recognition complex 1 protein [Hippea maritima DSM 10411]
MSKNLSKTNQHKIKNVKNPNSKQNNNNKTKDNDRLFENKNP